MHRRGRQSGQRRGARGVFLRAALVVALLALGPLPVHAGSVAGGQASIGTSSASQIGSADSARIAVSFLNTDTTNPVYCGATSSVSSSTGMKIPAGVGFTVDSCANMSCGANSAVYCIATGSTVTVSYWETR